MKVSSLVLMLTVLVSVSFARQDSVKVRRLVVQALEAILQDSAEVTPDRVILKVEYDFNSDGIPDVALSDCPNLCGNAGCEWSIYLGQPSGEYFLMDDQLFFNDGAMFIQPLSKGVSKIYTYSHFSGDEGSLEQYTLDSTGIRELIRTPADTANWQAFERLCDGKPSPLVVYSTSVQLYLKTREIAWKRWR